jgi:hypothetical protein
MRTLIFLALAVLAAGVLASSSAGNAGHTTAAASSVAAIADTCTSWAEFSSKLPDLQGALTREARMRR